MFKLDFYPSLIIPQSANTGLSRTFFLQADKVGHFLLFVSDFFLIFHLEMKSTNLSLLDLMLDGFQIQKPLVWLSQNTSGTCW